MQASAVFGDVVLGEDDEVVWNLVHGGLALFGGVSLPEKNVLGRYALFI